MSEESQRLNREDQPPRAGPVLPILRVRAGELLPCTVLSTNLWGCWTHWAGDRSEPCLLPKIGCPGCKRGLPKRWKGYLHIYSHSHNREGFLELTPASAEQLELQCPDQGQYRGLRIDAKRSPGGNRGRLNLSILRRLEETSHLPPPKDPMKTLNFLWGIHDALDEQHPPALQ